ncbi:DnaJ domain-containing protein [Caenispirillum bisanense]|uniref:DnaJ domain-containing protein n=1 Tax=Caenispirillum bisanense TaxID=414052 RepID=UPI0031DB0464
MSRAVADPKGFYRILGVAPDADGTAIKAAYRTRAKELHPDRNPSAHAAEAFAKVSEAYQVLNDPRRRAAYDRLAERVQAAYRSAGAQSRTAAPKAEARTAPPPPPPPQPPPRPHATRPHGRTAQATGGDSVCPCGRCGKVTAQPRHIIFRRVSGRLRQAVVTPIEGVFCRRCAQVTAVAATYASLLGGWWAFPRGPLETLRAVWINLRGGEMPADRNCALLISQARAFLARHETEVARGCAEQAHAFIRDAADRREVEHLLGHIPRGSRRLRDRWRSPGWAAPVQLLPLAVVIVAASLAGPGLGSLLSPAPSRPAAPSTAPGAPGAAAPAASPDAALSRPEALRPEVGRLNVIAVEHLAVRTGPGMGYRVSATLDKGASVLVNELSPDGRWARVLTAEGVAGFVAADGLRRRTSADK